MTLWTKEQVQTLADEVKAFVVKAEEVAHFLATNKTALGMATRLLPYVGTAFAVYQVYKDLGGKPMDASQIAVIDHDKTRDMPS
jgi:hypothetical protein